MTEDHAPRADGARGASRAGAEAAVLRGYASGADAERYAGKTLKGPVRRLSAWREASLVRSTLRGLGAGAFVLDAPCGAGRLLPVVGAGGRRPVGVDLSSAMLDLARRSGHPLVRGSALALPFRSGAFDAVVSVRLLHHYREHERGAILGELRRVARERVVVTVFDARSLKHRRRMRRAARRGRPSMRFGVSISGFLEEVRGAGLRPVRVRRLLPRYAELTVVEAV